MVTESLGIENPSFRACLTLYRETCIGSQDLLVAGFVFFMPPGIPANHARMEKLVADTNSKKEDGWAFARAFARMAPSGKISPDKAAKTDNWGRLSKQEQESFFERHPVLRGFDLSDDEKSAMDFADKVADEENKGGLTSTAFGLTRGGRHYYEGCELELVRDVEQRIIANRKRKKHDAKDKWWGWIWGGSTILFLVLLHYQNDFFGAFLRAFIILLILRVKWIWNLEFEYPYKKKGTGGDTSISEIGMMLGGVFMYGFFFLILTGGLLTPTVCGVQEWFHSDFLSTRLCHGEM